MRLLQLILPLVFFDVGLHATGCEAALIVNQQSAHVSIYLKALADSESVGSVVIVDTSGRSFAEARAVLGAKLRGTYPTTEALYAKQRTDLAVISLEPALAISAIKAALASGSHVLAEKPACRNAEEFEHLAERAKAAKRNLCLALANRLNPDIIFARDLVRSGKLGRIYSVEIHTVADQARLTKAEYQKSWFADKQRAGGGHLIWLGIHWLDLGMFVTQSNVAEVSAMTAIVGKQPITIEDAAVVSLRFDNGALGTMISGYFLDAGYQAHMKIWGERGWVQIDNSGRDQTEGVVQYFLQNQSGAGPQTYQPKVGPGYRGIVEACAAASLGRQEPPLTTDESTRVIKVIFAAYRSAETGQAQKP